MKMLLKATSAEDYKLLSSFEAVRQTLLEEKFADRWERPLAFWALPNDRRLPLAFLGRTVKDLLSTPFDELSATPGIGHKKISSLVKLLQRATQDQPPAVPLGWGESTSESPGTENGHGHAPPSGKFEPALVSEALWVQWQETVRTHNLGHEKLGRLAPTLQNLPTVIWHSPLSFYLDRTLAEIRALKTHGEKRVRVVLEVFYVVHEMLAGARCQAHLAVRLAPKFVPQTEAWIGRTLEVNEMPSVEDVQRSLTLPVLEQIMLDAGATVHKLAEGRLGLYGGRKSVRQQSRQMGVTRARVYQLLEECCKLMLVRWPEGHCSLSHLIEHLTSRNAAAETVTAVTAVRDLLFPDKPEEDDDGAE